MPKNLKREHVKKRYRHLLHNDKFKGAFLSSENLEIVKSIYNYSLFP